MLKLLLVGTDKSVFSTFVSTLEEHDDVELQWADSGQTALELTANTAMDLVITDEHIGDMTGLEFAEKQISHNPMINCACVSSLSPEEFHEASEGLGILEQLAPQPGQDDADNILDKLRHVKGLFSVDT